MSANRTRLLFADDTELLAPARTGILGRPEFDVQMAASTDEAIRMVSENVLGAVVLPASGSIDGVQVCRAVKSTSQGKAVSVVLALPADASARRDACFAAGADDVAFPPIDAAELAARLDRNAPAFRGAPRAMVELIVRLASPTGNAVVDAKAQQISREAVQVALPAGIAAPAPGILVRTVFTLYEGGTLQVWARVAPSPDAGLTVLRFVGLTEAERRAIDYFVDFYRKRAGVQPEPAAAQPETGGQSAEDLLRSLEAPPPASGETSALAAGETIRLLQSATLDALADCAAGLAAGRGDQKVPNGFDAARMRNWLPKLAPAETSALRGTTMYNSLLADLRATSAAKIRLFELNFVLRENGSRVDKGSAERIVLAAIAEAQQIHNGLEARFQDLLRGGNTAAIRDLTPVKGGLLSACVELKATLDRDVLGKEGAGAAARNVPKVAQPVRYERNEVSSSAAPEKSGRADAKSAAPSGSGRKRMGLVFLLVLLAAGAAWSNKGAFVTTKPRPFLPGSVQFETNGVRIWTSTRNFSTDTVTYVIDGSWDLASEEQRAAAVEEMVKRADDVKHVRVIDYRKRELATRDRS